MPNALLVAYFVVAGGLYGVQRLPLGSRAVGYLLVHFSLTLLALLVWKLGAEKDQKAALGAAILVRILLIGVTPFTSHDVHRYLWDGFIALRGMDPYAVSPEMVSVAGEWATALPDNSSYPTLYPPLALALFRVAACFGPENGVWAWKIFVTSISIGVVVGSFVVLKKHKKLRHFPLAALLPLSLLEGSVGAHVDMVAGLFILVGLSTLSLPWLAGAAMGLAVLTKLFPVVALPPLLLAFAVCGKKREAAKLGLAFAGVVVTGYGVAFLVDWSAVGSLGRFLREWEFGSPLYSGLAAIVGGAIARAVLLVVAAMAYVVLLGSALRGESSFTLMPKTFSILWLVSPVVFPWYLISLTVLVPFAPSPFWLAWLTLHPLTYEVIDGFDVTGVWRPAIWPLVFIFAGWLLAGPTARPLARRNSRP